MSGGSVGWTAEKSCLSPSSWSGQGRSSWILESGGTAFRAVGAPSQQEITVAWPGPQEPHTCSSVTDAAEARGDPFTEHRCQWMWAGVSDIWRGHEQQERRAEGRSHNWHHTYPHVTVRHLRDPSGVWKALALLAPIPPPRSPIFVIPSPVSSWVHWDFLRRH